MPCLRGSAKKPHPGQQRWHQLCRVPKMETRQDSVLSPHEAACLGALTGKLRPERGPSPGMCQQSGCGGHCHPMPTAPWRGELGLPLTPSQHLAPGGDPSPPAGPCGPGNPCPHLSLPLTVRAGVTGCHGGLTAPHRACACPRRLPGPAHPCMLCLLASAHRTTPSPSTVTQQTAQPAPKAVRARRVGASTASVRFLLSTHCQRTRVDVTDWLEQGRNHVGTGTSGRWVSLTPSQAHAGSARAGVSRRHPPERLLLRAVRVEAHGCAPPPRKLCARF